MISGQKLAVIDYTRHLGSGAGRNRCSTRVVLRGMMPTKRFWTYTEDVEVTDKDAVSELIKQYRFPGDVEVYFVPGTEKLRVDASNEFLEAYTVDSDEPQEVGLTVPQTPALGEFFRSLTDYIDPADELLVQLIGVGRTDEPLLGVEWVITADGVQETAFTRGDSPDWTDLPSNRSA